MMIYADITCYFLFYIGHISLVPQFYMFGSRSMLPVLPTILMSAHDVIHLEEVRYNVFSPNYQPLASIIHRTQI